MRITNEMRTNTTLRNVNRSKLNLSDIENQMSTEKKITRPSDDPIVAIRALSLRSSLAEIKIYLKNNIPEAQSWLKVTEDAMDNMNGLLTDVYDYCTQGSSDQFNSENRSAIIETLKKYRDAIYANANTDYAGRYCFSGFRTDSSFAFLDSENPGGKKYEIEEELTGKALSTEKYIANKVDIDTISHIDSADTPKSCEITRLRLAYSNCMDTNFSDVDVDGTTYTPTSVSYEDFEALVASGDYANTPDKMYFIYDKGEIAISPDLATSVKNAEEIKFTYQKDGFKTDEPKPEMYFNCKDISDPLNPHEYTVDDASGNREKQIITYNINFGQSLQINTLGCETLSTDIGRDIDEMCDSLNRVMVAEEKVSKLKAMRAANSEQPDEVAKIDSMIEAAQKEVDLEKDAMKKLFSAEMGKVKNYPQTVNLQLADLGARSNRLTLTESRLTEQYTTFDDLKSKNEDAELEETVVQYASTSTLYQAALGAASKCVQQTLLDYI